MPSSQATDPREKLAYRLTPETALLFGKLTGADRHTVVITSDRRPSSIMMEQAVSAGIIALGGTAYILDDVPAPSVPHIDLPYSYHINITSIDPNGLSGMEIFNSKGAYISAMDVFNMTYREMGLKYPEYNALGRVYHLGIDAAKRHIETLRARVQDCNCQVVLDGTYYRPAKLAARTLDSLNADVVMVKRHSTRYLPELDETDLQDLSRTLQNYKGAIGIALNSDGTRVAAFDNKGRYISGETIAVIFARVMNLRKVTVPIDMTMAIDEAVKTNGGVVIRAGHSFRTAVDTGISNGSDMIFDAEGHFVFTDTSYMADGIHAGLKLAEINGKYRLSEIIKEIDSFYSVTDSIRTQVNKNELNTNIRKAIEEEGYTYLDTGSIRIEFDDGWILIHLEEFDDSVSIKCEGRDRVYALSLQDIARGIVEDSIRKCN